MFDPVTILAALLPAGVEVLKGLGTAVTRRILPKEDGPRTFTEHMESRKLDLEQLKTLAEMDAGGETYKWVEAIRKLQRPFFVVMIASGFLYTLNDIDSQVIADLTSSVVFYLFGDRTLFYSKATPNAKR